jgi:acetylornithine deacetylase/succinyl-diaminopimelate desuccinylase-like protein
MNTSDIESHIKNLKQLLSIPSISAQGQHKADMKKACNWLQKKLKSLGFKVNILPTDGHPVVYAERNTENGSPTTLLIYGHYDVQDPGNLDEWASKPFKPTIRSGNIYARGAADDKGQLYTWIAAIEEILKNPEVSREVHPKGVPNIKFLIEGEEEVGSRNLDEFVERNKSLLAADVCVMSDSHCLSENQPIIDYGLRGIYYVELVLKSLGRDVHSGIYGGNVINPANLLAYIISKLKDDEHKIQIPGFYDNVRKLSKKERSLINKTPIAESDFIKETGAEVIIGEKEYTLAERAGARPTLDVNGVWGGYQGEGPKTIIPESAGAKISMRLVPNQTVSEIEDKFNKYVMSLIPKGVEVDLKTISTGEPILMDTSSRYFEAAERAYKKVFGKKPLYKLSGGSIPVTATFKNILGIDSVLMGYGLPDDGLHSPNEKLSLSMFKKGIKTNIEFLKNLT